MIRDRVRAPAPGVYTPPQERSTHDRSPGAHEEHSRSKEHFAGLVRIHEGATMSTIHSPSTAAHLIKALPKDERTWDGDARCWHIATYHVSKLALALTAAGYRVRVIRPGEPTPPVQLRTCQIRGAW